MAMRAALAATGLAAAAGILALAGCGPANTAAAGHAGQSGSSPGGTHGPAAPGGGPGPAGHSSASAGAGRSAGAPGAGSAPGQAARPLAALCPAGPDAGLAAGLSRSVGPSLQAEEVPLGISADGRTAYAATWTAAFSGVAQVDLASGSVRPIHAFGDPASDQADGMYSGQWLVWTETYSLQSLDTFTIYAWNAATGKLRRIGHSASGPGGVAWPSPWHPPAVSGSYAAWAQGYGPGGLVEIRLANLTTGAVAVIRTGHVQPPFFDGSLLVWPESDQPGTQTSLHAYSLVTGRAAALPPVLRAVHGTEFVASDGTRTAYFSPGLTALYYSASPQRQARVVLRLPAGTDFASLAMGAGTLAWSTTRATYLASTATGGYSQVTPQYGFAVTGQGTATLVSDAPATKAAHPILALHVVDAAGLRSRHCR